MSWAAGAAGETALSMMAAADLCHCQPAVPSFCTMSCSLATGLYYVNKGPGDADGTGSMQNGMVLASS